MMIYDEIKLALSVFQALHQDVLERYLSIRYDLTPALANSSLHKAVIAHQCYLLDNGFVTLSSNMSITSRHREMSRAFRVALEFMEPKEDSFLTSRILKGHSFDCLLHVIVPPDEETRQQNPFVQSRLVQICSIPTGNELALTLALAANGMPNDMRNTVCRIGIVEPSFRHELTKKVGFIMFIPFKKDAYDFQTGDVINEDDTTRWKDVTKA